MKRSLAMFLILVALLLMGLAPPEPAVRPEQIVPDWQAWYYKDYKDLTKDCAYYRNPANAIGPALQRFDAAIDFNWGTGGPSDAVGKDNFLACWEVQQTFARGCYRFHTYTDDGVRLFINNQRILDHWTPQPPTEHTVDVIVPGDSIEYLLRVDYFERTDQALARVWWESLSRRDLDRPECQDYPNWKGEYFRTYFYDPTNPDAGRPSGGPVFTRDDINQSNPDDPGLDFDWGLGSPGVGLSHDHFAVRWTRTLDFAGGYYRFYTRTDDGVRLWVDGTRLINHWHPQSTTTHYADVYLKAGSHTVRLEYFETVGIAQAKLWWEAW